MACAAVVAGAVGSHWFGADAYQSSALAATLIFVVDAAALALAMSTPSGPERLNAVLFGIVVRMGIPLAALIALTGRAAAQFPTGIATLLLVHYLVGLVFGTFLCVRLLGEESPKAGSPSGSGPSSPGGVVAPVGPVSLSRR